MWDFWNNLLLTRDLGEGWDFFFFQTDYDRSVLDVRDLVGVSQIKGKSVPLYKVTLFVTGGDLLSQAVSSQVPSALKGLTSVFGMRTGGTPSPLPPEWLNMLCTLTTAQYFSV